MHHRPTNLELNGPACILALVSTEASKEELIAETERLVDYMRAWSEGKRVWWHEVPYRKKEVKSC